MLILYAAILLSWILPLSGQAAGPNPAPSVPGEALQPPAHPTAPGAPVIYEHSGEAGPDETFFLVGDTLTNNLSAWGASAENGGGQEWKPRVQFLTKGYLAATMPERAQDGPFVVWMKNAAGWSAPLVLNAPQPWWCGPDRAAPGGEVRVFGRNLARRPDFSRAFVYLCQAGKPGVWAQVSNPGKYAVTFRLPQDLAAGEYQVWLHAGAGGEYGWGGPVKLHVTEPDKNASFASLISTSPTAATGTELKTGASGAEIQRALDALATRGGGTLRLPAGQFNFSGTMRIPAKVTLAGAGREATTLQLVRDATVSFPRLGGSGWNQAPGGIQNAGDTIEYALGVPQSGEWTVWLRYATDMKPWGQSGVSGNQILAVDGGTSTPLMNLENTGGWGDFRWARAAKLKLSAGRHTLTWKNVKGGGISLDAFVFAFDPAYAPAQTPLPTSGERVLVLQGEDCTRFLTREGKLPGGSHAALWLAGDSAGARDLTVLGNAQVNYGAYIGSPQPLTWLNECSLERVRLADCDGKQGENCGAYVRYASHARLHACELWGRAPLFISGARQSEFANNRLVSVTRYGGNAEAAILGRTETIEECVIEGNVIAAPPGAEAGGPTARRLLWFSTGHGSVTHNWIAGNGVEKPNGPGASMGAGQARFGGVAGTDQNVGEMILFEGNHRTAYFGPLAGAGAQSVTLPKTLPPTPEGRLGSVKREQLAHDASGNETPFWPPDGDDGSDEPPLGEYYVSIFSGAGQGQTRRVVRREEETLLLDRPWSVPPRAGSVVAVGTAFYRNLIAGNNAADGMTGIQLWISCIENIVTGNTIVRQRRPPLFLYANGTTLASSMPRTWNRGVSPLFWNVCEGNRAEECSTGALVTSGDERDLPIEFPRALGNVLRHNSFSRSRSDGVNLSSRGKSSGVTDSAASITGSIVEFNVVRDATVGYHAGASCDGVVFRRNHAYFWYPVNNSTDPPAAFQVDGKDAVVALESNSIEDIQGNHSRQIRDLVTPAGVQRLQER